MKYKCTICGHIYDEEKEGVKFADLPADWKCPICKQPKSKFEPVDENAELSWASEHKIGIASDLSDEMKDFLRAEFSRVDLTFSPENVLCTRDLYVRTRRVKDGLRVPWPPLQKVTSRIINEVRHVNRVMYDITSKPPGTIELE